ncbi:MAG: glycoside hydrolase family 3 N-terminal domain-containing protein [Pseudomonadota bacterium]
MHIWRILIVAMGLALGGPGAQAADHHPSETPLTQMIGQMIMVGFLGNTQEHFWFRKVAEQVNSGKVTGVLYLARNVRDQAAVSAMNQVLAGSGSGGLPPLIGIDQEGGYVQRLTPDVGFLSLPSARRIARTMEPADARDAYGALAQGLNNWGFNLNLGPVVDVDVNPYNPIIGRLGRSYSNDPNKVTEYASAFVEAHRKYDVLTALKHFPGHGSSRTDSHKTDVDVSETWQPGELEPFRALIRQRQADIVMSGHIRNRRLQRADDHHPASLSHAVLTQLLRSQLGFSGVIISDDMQMRAVSARFGFEEAVKKAVFAGNDILIFANDKTPDLHIPDKVIAVLASAAETNAILRARIKAAYQRVVNLKRKLRQKASTGATLN